MVARHHLYPSAVSHLLRTGAADNDASRHRVHLTLERGLAIEGRIITTDDQPVSSAIIDGREVHRDRSGTQTLPFLPQDTLDVVRIGKRLRLRSSDAEEDGTFRLQGLHACSYGLFARAAETLRAQAAGVEAGETDV